jgi:curved DNA-binding protein CbpA
MSTEYKQKNDLPDLYHILGLTIDVCKDPKCDEIIKKAFIKKAKLCHPDKHKGRKDIEEVFELLTSTYDILRDENQRSAYNHKLTLDKQSSGDFFKLRKAATDYSQTFGEYKEPSNDQKLSFKEQMHVLDTKHNFNSSTMDPISQHEAKKKLNDLNKSRYSQDRDLKPMRLFDEGHFDRKKFNEAFDLMHNRDDNAVVAHNGVPSAWNDMGTIANFSNFDDLDNLYVDNGNRYDTSRQMYGGIDFGATPKKLSKDEIKNLKGADYVDGHNAISDDYYKDLKTKLRDRESSTSSFESMSYGDFKRDDTAGYGIFDQLGYKFSDRLHLDVDEDDISKKFERLMNERQKDLLSINNKNSDQNKPSFQKNTHAR